jgi:hypothetical protein
MVSIFARMSLNIEAESSALDTVSSPDNLFFLVPSSVDMMTARKTAKSYTRYNWGGGGDRILKPHALPRA